MGSTLLEAARRGEEYAFPHCGRVAGWRVCARSSLVRCAGVEAHSSGDEGFGPGSHDASFRETAMAAYESFAGMAVAGVAYHF